MRLDQCHSIDDLRRRARRRLPSPLFHYIDGGADDEVTLGRNTAAFQDYDLLPSQLHDVAQVDLSTTLLGRRIDWPVMLSPTGMSRLFHHHAEPAVARAAARTGTFYGLSTLATTGLEAIAQAAPGPKMFQVYVFRDRGLTREFVDRCQDAGYDALCLTVDMAVAGNRERDRKTGMTMPPSFTLASLASFLAHPAWAANLLRHPDFSLANVAHRADVGSGGAISLIDYVNAQLDPSVTWQDAAWLAKAWGGKFVIKGIQTVADARRAADIGAHAVMVSNHGGRQLDGVAAPVDCIAAIAEAVGDRIEIILDGGVRRGTHVLKALALGADACAVGRAYLYGLAAGGYDGVMRALTLLRGEIARDMALLGCRTVREVSPHHIRWRGSPMAT